MLPDLNRIKVFYYIFDTRSVALAAKELNITSSAVSQALAKLEAELKVPLFTRLHRKLVPTYAGEQLFTIAAPFIRELEAGVERILKSKDVPSGMLRIGSPIEFGKSYFPGVFAAFRRHYPEVVFTMKLGDPSEVLPMISNGELDFGLVDIFLTRGQVYGDLGRFSIEPLIDEEVILACSKTYYDREIRGDHSFENLVTKEYISYQKTSLTLRKWFKYHFNRFSIDLNRVMIADSHQAVINGILHDLGMGVIARHIVKDTIERGEIVPVKTEQADVINKISLVQLQDKIPSLTEKTFIKFLKQDILDSGMSDNFRLENA
ncbi:MAG TPA: LysR family transcriptional regulator [Desulfobacteraceae bacterium]|nr:LysR family transcriptional regulator [Desulfobacteraceae bacterium]